MKDHYSKQIRTSFTMTLNTLYPDTKSLKAAADELEISIETARQARDYGKGSVETLVGLVMHGLEIAPSTLNKSLPKILKVIESSAEFSVLENLIHDVSEKFGHYELIAWLRLLIARHEIEKEVGLKKNRKSIN